MLLRKRRSSQKPRFSPDRMVKAIVDEIHRGTAPLGTVVQNQGMIIGQNKQIVELLQRICTALERSE